MLGAFDRPFPDHLHYRNLFIIPPTCTRLVVHLWFLVPEGIPDDEVRYNILLARRPNTTVMRTSRPIRRYPSCGRLLLPRPGPLTDVVFVF
jgi:hypothetical protein